MTRAELNATIIGMAASREKLRHEIQHQMEIGDRDFTYDETCALIDTENNALQWRDAVLLKQARDVLIYVGFYRVMPEREIKNYIFVSNANPWIFKRKGVPYISDYTYEEWFDPMESDA